MEYQLLLDSMVNKIKSIKEENYKKYNYKEPKYRKVVKKVDYSTEEFKNSVDFKSFHIDLKKQARYEKTKPGNARMVEYEEDQDCKKVNILTDDIFEKNVNLTETKVKMNISEMSVKDIMKDIHLFLKRKNIQLSEEDICEIEKAIEDPVFEREKYIKYSKSTKTLSKLEFIKKIYDDSYEVSFNNNEKEKEKEKKEEKYVRKSFFKKC
jgi:hypothetical protein